MSLKKEYILKFAEEQGLMVDSVECMLYINNSTLVCNKLTLMNRDGSIYGYYYFDVGGRFIKHIVIGI